MIENKIVLDGRVGVHREIVVKLERVIRRADQRKVGEAKGNVSIWLGVIERGGGGEESPKIKVWKMS